MVYLFEHPRNITQVPDIQELTKFGISLKDVLDTFRRIQPIGAMI